MTPDQLTATLRRLGLSQAALGRLLGSHEEMVSRWANGVHRVPAGVVAFLKLWEEGVRGVVPLSHPTDVEIRLGVSLLRFCAERGLTAKQARQLIGQTLRQRRNRQAVHNRCNTHSARKIRLNESLRRVRALEGKVSGLEWAVKVLEMEKARRG